MSLRQVLTIYNAERQLNEDDVALLNTLRKLNDNDREMLVQGLSDKPQKKSSKKSAGGGGRSKALCVTCGHGEASVRHSDNRLDNYHPYQSPAGKSKRASGMAAAIDGNLSRRRREMIDDVAGETSNTRCQFIRMDGGTCKLLPDHNIHHLPTANEYHEFQPLPSPRCAFRVTDIERCSATEDDPIHDEDANPATYHDFVPPASSAAGSGG